MKQVKIKLEEGVNVPLYATEGSVGFDLIAKSLKALYKGTLEVNPQLAVKANESDVITLRGFERALFGTGTYVELPVGTEIQIRPRSGVSLKRGLIVVPGTIDHDYRGEIGIIIINNTPFLNTVKLGEKIAQGILNNIEIAHWEVVSELSETVRGEGGFGHTSEKQNT